MHPFAADHAGSWWTVPHERAAADPDGRDPGRGAGTAEADPCQSAGLLRRAVDMIPE